MPEPVLSRAPLPLMPPEKAVLVLAPPVVRVALPRVTLPAPASDPTAWLRLARSSVAPLATVTALLMPKVLTAPAFRVPDDTVVAPP